MKNISLAQLQHSRVLVVGDVMLDRYWYGSVDRISPEAPVPVVRVTREEERLGGSAECVGPGPIDVLSSKQAKGRALNQRPIFGIAQAIEKAAVAGGIPIIRQIAKRETNHLGASALNPKPALRPDLREATLPQGDASIER